jgi:hypothetical protein
MEVTSHDIIKTLTNAMAHAETLGGRYPQYHDAIVRFSEGVRRAQEELIRKIRPEVIGTENGV